MRTKQKPRIVVFLAAAIALAGCGDRFRREKQIETEIVSESSVSGVTSTIVAPGEKPPPLAGVAPLTGTNADTTTAFTILDSGVSTTAIVDPGSLAGTMPLPGANDPGLLLPPSPPPARESVISIERSTPAPTSTQAEPAAAAEPVAPLRSESTDPSPAPAQTSSESEPAEDVSDSSEPPPSPTAPENTSTTTATNPD